MKVGDLVKQKIPTGRLGLGLVTCDEHTRVDGGGYVWVAFQNWTANDKWCAVETLEVISECQISEGRNTSKKKV